MSDHFSGGGAELRSARKESQHLYWAVGLFSCFVNLLMLTGPLYMLNVYDRVLSSRSVETLLALSLLAAFLYGIMGLLDYVRSRVMARIGARFQSRLERRIFQAVLDAKTLVRAPREAATGMQDLEAVQRSITSPSMMSLFDLPWSPIFFLGIFLFHEYLGILAIFGGLTLLVISAASQLMSKSPVLAAHRATFSADQFGGQVRTEAELAQALGMQEALFDRWQVDRRHALEKQIAAADITGSFTAAAKTFRLLLQSAMLGLGAYLVLLDQLSPGAMIAGSILLGRALAPIEALVGQWPNLQRGREGWRNLSSLLNTVGPDTKRTSLPAPKAHLVVNEMSVLTPGSNRPYLRGINFEVKPGQAVGIIGTSGSGKSTLARALTGVWQPAVGEVRLDGATLDQYDPNVRGRRIGYLPQRVQLFDGTIRDNIARMTVSGDDNGVIAAAKAAAAHELILSLHDGYDTYVGGAGNQLSGGQLQRIALARALYLDPVVVILDEPNSNLDNEGSIALNAAIQSIKADDRIVFVMAHRPAAIKECDMLLVLDQGQQRAFGPRDQVLEKLVKNHRDLTKNAAQSGGIS